MTTVPVYLTLVVCATAILTVVTHYRLEQRMATNQQRLDAISTQLSSIATQTRKAHSEIVNKIEALKNQESALDFSALEQTVEQLGVAADALDSVVPDEIDAEDPVEPVTSEGGTSEPVGEDEQSDPVPSDEAPKPVARTSSKRSK